MASCNESNARIEYTGNGSQRAYSFPFEYNDVSEINVSVWDPETKEYVAAVRNDDWYLSNPTTVSFVRAPDTEIVIYRCTDISSMEVIFSPGSPIKAADLNDDYDQLRRAIEETRAGNKANEESIIELDDVYLNRISVKEGGDLVKANSELTISDEHVATTQWIDNRYWDRCEETTTSTDTWADELDNAHIPTTLAVENRLATFDGGGSSNALKPGDNVSELVNDAGYITDAGVSKIVAGTNVVISPSDGTGTVTISSIGGGGDGDIVIGTLQLVTDNGNTTDNSIIVGPTVISSDGDADFDGDVKVRERLTVLENVEVYRNNGSLPCYIAGMEDSEGTLDTAIINADGTASFAKGQNQIQLTGNQQWGGSALGTKGSLVSVNGTFYATPSSGTEAYLAYNEGSSTPTVTIKGDGSATFAGNVQCGTIDGSSTSANGSRLYADGALLIQKPAGSMTDVFTVYTGNASNISSSIKADGSADFDGDLTVGHYASNTSGAKIFDNNGSTGLYVNGTGSTSRALAVYNGSANSYPVSITHNGAAEFAGTITAKGYSFEELDELT